MLPGMAPRGNRVGDILVKAGLIDPLQLRSALARHDQWGGRLAKIVVDLGFVPEDAVVEALAKELFLKRVQLGRLVKDAQALRKLDALYCESQAVFPVSLKDNGKTLVLAMADPTDLQVVDEVAMKARARVLVMCAGEQEIQSAIGRYYHSRDADDGGQEARHRFPLGPDAGGEEGEVVDLQGGGSASFMMNELFPDAAPPPERAETFGPEERARLKLLGENQEKSSRVLQALTELLAEKGLPLRRS